MSEPNDNRRVALIKSLATGNRFYVLIDPARGIRNADAVASIPDDLTLGIAYPCLEDGLNDFAVIRTTFETLDLFPEDDPIREEMMEIINDARGNLLRRLHELHDKLDQDKAHFLGTDYQEFKDRVLDITGRGYSRRNLDSMMKLNVFTSVAEAEGITNGEGLYRFEFHHLDGDKFTDLSPREFIAGLFNEVIKSVLDDANYKGRYVFDKIVFQKFIAVMFVNYATTDPMFYGINRGDYGVSADKDMDSTPLYRAVKQEIMDIEARQGKTGGAALADPFASAFDLSGGTATEPDFSGAFTLPEKSGHPSGQLPTFEQASIMLPSEMQNEEVLMGPIQSLCTAAQLLMQKNDPETQRYARVVLADACKLVEELKRLNIVSPFANNPGICDIP